MVEESLKSKTVKGVIWNGMGSFSAQGIHFIVMLVIARILSPKDFGLVGMLAVFIEIAQSFVDSGFSQALIRKQNRSDVDNCTIFFFNILVASLLYIILFLMAPWVASFYNEPQLLVLMRVLCLIIVINSFNCVQNALFTSKIDFKTIAKVTIISALMSGIVGVYMALKGMGVWTLVWQQLIDAFIRTILLWFYSSWFPRLSYSWKSFKELFSFGSKLLVSGLLETLYKNMYTLVIGKVFSASSLGFYTQANRFTLFPSANLTSVLQRVTYPVLCKLQNDELALQNAYRRLLRVSAFIIFPLMCLLAGVSTPLVELILGRKWLFAATLIVPLCFSMMWFPIHSINLNLLEVKGRSDLFLKVEIIKKVIGVAILVFSIQFGLLAMCWIGILGSLISLIVNTYYTGKLIKVGFLVQMRDLSGTLITSLLTFCLAWAVTLFVKGVIIQLIIGVVAGSVFFVGTCFLFRFKEIEFLKSIVRQ